jgi:hypothetical protein
VAIGHIDEPSLTAAVHTVPFEIVLVVMCEETESAGQKAQPVSKVRGRRANAFAAEVYAAVRSGKLAQPFSAETAKRACPGWSEGTYRNFFNKHRVGNPGGLSELFVRRVSNRFEIINSK